ncbi:MAG: hypothetical protein HYV27_10805 [Candidatus Hydrogenedentes bacterium]|nr:hypothetical protein [Candidatus Hydrogenedentota bacterium]
MQARHSRIFLFLISIVLGIAPAIGAQTYSLSDPVALVADSFYDGAAGPGASESASGRLIFAGEPSKAGDRIAFVGIDRSLTGYGYYVVDIGAPESWRRIAGPVGGDIATPLGWSSDDSHVFANRARINVTTGEVTPVNYVVDGNSYALNDGNATAKSSGNWVIGVRLHQIIAMPVLMDGSLDPGRESTTLTNFPDTSSGVEWPTVSPSGNQIGFAWMTYLPLVNPGDPDLSDVYVLKNVDAILAAPKEPGTSISTLAPTSLNDPNIVTIRTTEDSVDNFAHVPTFSQDESLVIYGEDWYNVFNDDEILETMAVGNWDVMISSADGSGADYRIVDEDPMNVENALVHAVTPGGIRIIYVGGGGFDMRLYAVSLESNNAVEGDDVSNTTVEVDLGGGEILEVNLNDNAVQIPESATEPVVIGDASETTVVLPPAQIVEFPSGVPQAISITTPVNPVEEIQLPPNVDAIPVLREFGPSGTNFYPPVLITLSYTDAEVMGLIEANLQPFLFNSTSMLFEPLNPADIVARDTVNNTITFKVSHFSVYGLGGGEVPMPLSAWAWAGAFIGLLLAALYRLRRGEKALTA